MHQEHALNSYSCTRRSASRCIRPQGKPVERRDDDSGSPRGAGAVGAERTRARPYTVDIDIGGTLTDGLFSDGETVTPVKVDTTPHDFTVCFFECLKEGAKQLGFDDLTALLQQVAVIRWSATIATNIIAERKGPRIGLLVSEETGDELYGDGDEPGGRPR